MLKREHSTILSTFTKLPFVINIFVLSNFEWPLYTGLTQVLHCIYKDQDYRTFMRKIVFFCIVFGLFICYLVLK